MTKNLLGESERLESIYKRNTPTNLASFKDLERIFVLIDEVVDKKDE